jgi:NAD(P)-dependent dehydrogenase (short-subunit alcohol dehydrogenase family)
VDRLRPTAKLATELRDEGIRVDAADPGLTATAPGMEAMGARPVREGARSIVAAVLRDRTALTGTFTRDGDTLPW